VEFAGLSSEGTTTNTCALALWLSSRADMAVFVSRRLLCAPAVRQSPVKSPPLVNALSDVVTGEHVARFVGELRALGLKRTRYHIQITGTWPSQPMPMHMVLCTRNCLKSFKFSFRAITCHRGDSGISLRRTRIMLGYLRPAAVYHNSPRPVPQTQPQKTIYRKEKDMYDQRLYSSTVKKNSVAPSCARVLDCCVLSRSCFPIPVSTLAPHSLSGRSCVARRGEMNRKTLVVLRLVVLGIPSTRAG
jgi:hypothetical protein